MLMQLSITFPVNRRKITVVEIDERISGRSPLGRPGFFMILLRLVALLSSSGSQLVTGHNFHASGGAHMAS